MKTLFRTIHGSRLYGTNTPASDTDWKSVVLLPIQHLLRGIKVSNSVSSTGDKHGANTADDTDDELIPFQVLAKDFVGGQTYALELVFVTLQRYSQGDCDDIDPYFIHVCNELASKYLTRNVNAAVGYAMNQANKYGIKGTRLNSLRAFHELVTECHDTYPKSKKVLKLGDSPKFLAGVAKLAAVDPHIRSALYFGPRSTDVANPIDPAVILLEKTFGHEIDFDEAVKRTSGMLKKYGARAHKAAVASGKDWKAISHALRIIDQATDVLVHETLEFPLPRADYYREVKEGKHAWKEVSVELEEGMKRLEAAQATTTLPDGESPEFVANFHADLDEWLMTFYKGTL